MSTTDTDEQIKATKTETSTSTGEIWTTRLSYVLQAFLPEEVLERTNTQDWWINQDSDKDEVTFHWSHTERLGFDAEGHAYEKPKHDIGDDIVSRDQAVQIVQEALTERLGESKAEP